MYSQEKKPAYNAASNAPLTNKGDQETLYPNVETAEEQKLFNLIDAKNVGTHQQNKGGYKAGNALYTKDEAKGNAGATKKKAREPDAEDLKKMKIGRDWNVDLKKKHVDVGFEVEFKSTMPKQVQTKLKEVASKLIWQDLTADTIGIFSEFTSLSLGLDGSMFPKLSPADKKKYAGETVFEFTRIKNEGHKRVVLITELGKNVPATVSTADKESRSKKFHKHFTLDSSWTDPAELEILYATIHKIPDSILGQVPSLVFKRQPAHIENGATDTNTLALHTLQGTGESNIAVFNVAFAGKQAVRFGDANSGFSGVLEQAIIHEIGHAIDSRKQKKALQNKDAAFTNWSNDRKALAEAEKQHGPCYLNDKGYDKTVTCAVKTSQEKSSYNEFLKRKDISDKSVSETGRSFGSNTISDPDTDFLKALKADDSQAVTKYGRTSDGENYAEMFALYILDEVRFHKIRPNVYAYFKKNFPK